MQNRLLEAMRRRPENEGGFTLIELLVVIVILGILAAVVVFSVGGVQDKGQASACKIDDRTLRTAEEAYSAQPGPGGGAGKYTPQDDVSLGKPPPNNRLVTGGFLSAPPSYHKVTTPNGAEDLSFEIVIVPGKGC